MTIRQVPWADETEKEFIAATIAQQTEAVRNAPDGAIFEYTWRNKFLCIDATNIDEFRDTLADAVATLDRWKALGVTLVKGSGIEDDYATFQTDSKEVALAEGFVLAEPDVDDEDMDADDIPPYLKRLAALGGAAPDMQDIPRRREEPDEQG